MIGSRQIFSQWLLVPAFILASGLGVSVAAQQQGPVGVQSNGVSISFQNSGGDATASKGVSISFQNAGGDAKGSNGVSISFANAGDAAGGASSGVTIGFGQVPCARCSLGSNPNAGVFADPVNTATGNFTFDKTDMTVAGRGFNFEFKRFYNAQDDTAGPLGANWTHSYNLKVAEDATTATITYEDGRDEVYDKSGPNYVPTPGTYNKLVKNANNTYTVTQRDQKKLNFKTNGKLDTIVDRNNNIASMVYDGNERLTRVDIPGGRHVDLTYDAQNRIASITDTLTPTPRTVVYGYDANNDLVSVSDVRGNLWQ